MIQFDSGQQRAIEAKGGHYLVLAPPGCGKTETLAHRVRYAHDTYGVAYDDMLCLTFTNRAARGMRQRISQTHMSAEGLDGLFVGNIHRFCSRLLLADENQLTHPDTNIIDENDYADLLDQFGLTKAASKLRLGRADANPLALTDAQTEVNRLEHYLYQVEAGHPQEVWLRDQSQKLADYFAPTGIRFNPMQPAQAIGLLRERFGGQDNAETRERIIAALGTDHFPLEKAKIRCYALFTSILMAALDYGAYKRQNHLLDFDDILCRSYDVLTSPNYRERYHYTCYSWIQIDEVQDLNALQLAIVDRITAPTESTVVYLGDEQQSIFSFMGAKTSTLSRLMRRCGSNLIRLNRNHRSPRYLLDIFNTYATQQLGIEPSLLPTTDDATPATSADLVLRQYEYYAQTTSQGMPYRPAQHAPQMLEAVVPMLRFYLSRSQTPQPAADQAEAASAGETAAVIVSTNQQAEEVAAQLRSADIPFFKISGQDVFRQMDFKALLAHFIVLTRENSFLEWARLLYKSGACLSFTDARRLMRRLRRCALMPTDLLDRSGSSYLNDFCRVWQDREVVIFDTETTGLDVAADDIVQIAAVKVRGGKIVAGSELDLLLHTDRPIPDRLGELDNPLPALYARRAHLDREEGLRRFLDYVGTDDVIGHNVGFDSDILRHNVRRTLGLDVTLTTWDSLRLARLVEPQLHSYKLKDLLTQFNLEGENSHLASDDIMATKSLLDYLAARGADLLPQQQALLAEKQTMLSVRKFADVYGPLYRQTRSLLDTEVPLPVEMQAVYDRMLAAGMIGSIDRFDYILRFVAAQLEQADVIRQGASPAALPTLAAQLASTVNDVRTYSEADLCESGIISERVYILTVHKAKGLEFDNVIVFDATDGRYPFFGNTSAEQDQEDARRFYVAMSRAKRRLCIVWSRCWVWEGDSAYGHSIRPMQKQLTRFMSTIQHFFRQKNS